MAATTERRRLTYGFVAKATLVVLTIWALAQAFWMVRDIAFIGFAAILLATLFSLGVDRMEAMMPRWGAAVLVLLLFLGVLFGIGFLGWPTLEGQVSTLREQVPRLLGDAIGWVEEQYDALMPTEARQQVQDAQGQAPPPQAPQDGMGAQLANLASGALPVLNTAIGAFTGIVVVIFAAVFLVIDPDVYVRGVLHLVPEKARPDVERALRDAGIALKRWIAGMSISMVVIFATSTLGLWLLGVPAPVALGLIAGFLVFIPFIGPILSAIPAMAMALTVSPIMVAWVGLLYFGIQLLESNFLTPVIMREAVELEPAATILFQLAMGVLFGFLGLFFAVPLFAAGRVLLERLYIEPLETAPQSGSAAR